MKHLKNELHAKLLSQEAIEYLLEISKYLFVSSDNQRFEDQIIFI